MRDFSKIKELVAGRSDLLKIAACWDNTVAWLEVYYESDKRVEEFIESFENEKHPSPFHHGLTKEEYDWIVSFTENLPASGFSGEDPEYLGFQKRVRERVVKEICEAPESEIRKVIDEVR